MPIWVVQMLEPDLKHNEDHTEIQYGCCMVFFCAKIKK